MQESKLKAAGCTFEFVWYRAEHLDASKEALLAFVAPLSPPWDILVAPSTLKAPVNEPGSDPFRPLSLPKIPVMLGYGPTSRVTFGSSPVG